jgi:hypothetical protein
MQRRLHHTHRLATGAKSALVEAVGDDETGADQGVISVS